MKNITIYTILRKISLAVIFIFVAAILALSVKGVTGNPTPNQIYTDLRDATKPFELSPERGRYAIVQSLIDDRSFSFSSSIAEYVAPDLGYKNGKFVSLFAPGISILALPFYYVGAQYNLAQVATFSLSAVFAFLNFYLIYTFVKRETSSTSSGLISGIVFTFATNAWSYSTSLYQHHATAFLILWSLYLLSKPLRRYTPFIIAFLAGIGFMIEYPNILFFIPIGLLLIKKSITITETKETVSVSMYPWILTAIMGITLSLIPSFWYNLNSYGSPTQLASTVRGLDEFNVNWESGVVDEIRTVTYAKSALSFFSLERLPNSMTVLLTSADRGLLVYAPIVLLGLLGIYPLYKKKPELTVTIVVEVFAILLLYGMWGDPWGGWAFGPRYLIPVHALLSVLFGIALSAYGRKLWFALLSIPVFIYSLSINIIGAFTTNQLPPSVEVDYALFPKYLYWHGVDLVIEGVTGSYLYNNYLLSRITLEHVVMGIGGFIVLLYLCLYLVNAIKEEKYEI